MSSTYYRGIDHVTSDTGGWGLEERWPDVEPIADLRPDDTLLDIGCAEGLLTFEVASRVRSIQAYELEVDRIEAAKKLQADRGIDNIAFQVGSICDLSFKPDAFDVVLFLGVIHHLSPTTQIPSVEKCLTAARRQVLIRTPIQRPQRPNLLLGILDAAKRFGFEGLCFANKRPRGGNIIVLNRQGVEVCRDGYPTETVEVKMQEQVCNVASLIAP